MRGISRRGFLASAVTAMGAAGMPAWYAKEVLAAEQERLASLKRVGANGKITFALIGCGGMGRGDVGRFKGRPDCQLVALCDVDSKQIDDAAGQLKATDVARYKDFRECINHKDLDFVIVATPDHWHTLPTIAAMKAGKDVYCEKPLTLTVEEGKTLVKVAKKTNKILQTGSQQRSEGFKYKQNPGNEWHLACSLVRNNRLGKLSTVETFVGKSDQGGPFQVTKAPETLDWNFWQGQTASVPYVKERCHYQFRWWYEYSGGKMTDWGAHMNDIAQWGLGMDGSGPISVEATGTPPEHTEPNSYNCHASFNVIYTYGNGVKLICSSKTGTDPSGKPFKNGEGVRFTGEKGWIWVSRADIVASDPKLLDEPLGNDAIKLELSTSHGGNFIDCYKSRKQPICNVEVGHRSVSVCHIGNICLRAGLGKLNWNPVEERFEGNNAEAANKWLSREMRAPWKLEA